MKRIGLLLLLVVVSSFSLKGAEINIVSGKNYRFVCENWQGTGYMVLGKYHNSTAYVFYDISSDGTADDCLWTVTADGGGYTIKNAKTGEYLVYAEGQETNASGNVIAKGLRLATEVTGNNGRWTFGDTGQGALYIANVAAPGQYFNTRNSNSDTPYLVGTYSNYSSANGFFNLYDEEGNSVLSNSGDNGSGGTTADNSPISGTSGTTEDGAVWERTGLTMPVVITTDTSNPVLYTIRNVRSGKYALADGQLSQSESEATQFYFINSGSGVQVRTASEAYVSTSFLDYYADYSYSLQLYSGNSSDNAWSIGYYSRENTGYTLKKLDNLPGTSIGGVDQSRYLYWNDYNKSGIGLYDLDGGSTFVFYSSDQRHIDYLQQLGIDIGSSTDDNVKALRQVVDSIRVGGKDLVYDTSAREYYCPIPPSVEDGGTFETTLEWRAKNGNNAEDYTIEIGGQSPAADGSLSIEGVTGRTASTLRLLRGGEVVGSVPLHFTFMPIVEVTLADCNSYSYTTGRIRVTDPETAVYDSTFIAAFRYRGASALSYAKKSYAIKLRDAQGNSVDREFFGLRNDNNWILDAMAVDHSCMRNRVSTDLWNDFSTKPYHVRAGLEPKARTGTRGRFVEVFLNGRYHGLYCMTEKMDRKQLKLKKYDATTGTIHGTLFKSSQWNYEVMMGHEIDQKYFPMRAPASYNNNYRSETWQNYEVKYPDYEEEKVDWGPLWNAINMTATTAHVAFKHQYDQYFDTPVLDDYYLFIELMLATDNHGKNMFFFNYDQTNEEFKDKIGIAPWDLDGTWGMRWDGSTEYTGAVQGYDTFLWEYEHGNHTIFYHLLNYPDSDTFRWYRELKDRYYEVRPQYFNPDNLKKRFRDYADLFARSGADEREQDRWSSSGIHRDIQNAVDYVCNWIESRMQYLDAYYQYKEVSGISKVEDNSFLEVAGGKGEIAFKTLSPSKVDVYTADGRLVRSLQLKEGMTVADGFAPGIYVAGGKKIVVR